MIKLRISVVPFALLSLFILLGCMDKGVGGAQTASVPDGSLGIALPAPSPSRARPPMVQTMLDPKLLESRDCKTVVSFYADAIHAGLYGEAALVWSKHWGVSAATLEKRYSAGQPVTFEFRSISVEGGAGSLYCEVVAVLKTKGNQPQNGKISLRRVNDVPGATADQLRWHITSSTFSER